ncbi:MAG: hypothetical protein ACI9VT_003244 [Psychroserpens sp.]|jgi:hypothetical protein
MMAGLTVDRLKSDLQKIAQSYMMARLTVDRLKCDLQKNRPTLDEWLA